MPLTSREQYDRVRAQLANEAFRSSYPKAAEQLQRLIDEYERSPQFAAAPPNVGMGTETRPAPPTGNAAIAAQIAETPDVDLSPDLTNAPRTPGEIASDVADKATAFSRGLMRSYMPGSVAPGDRLTAILQGQQAADANIKAEAENPGYSMTGSLGGLLPGAGGSVLYSGVNRALLNKLNPLGAAAPLADRVIAGTGAGAAAGGLHGLTSAQETGVSPAEAAGITGTGFASGAALGMAGPVVQRVFSRARIVDPLTGKGIAPPVKPSPVAPGPPKPVAAGEKLSTVEQAQVIASRPAALTREALTEYEAAATRAGSGMSTEQQEAVRAYMTHGPAMNQLLAGGKDALKELPQEQRKALVEQTRRLQAALLEAKPGTTYAGQVYRGQQMSPEELETLAVGGAIRTKGLWSTSINPDYAGAFSAGREKGVPVLFRIEQDAGVPIGKVASGKSGYSLEREVLIPAGRTFKVVGRSKLEDGTEVIDLWQK